LRAWLAARGHALESVAPPSRRLDEIFLERVGRADARREEGGK
jgi:hypothetical protein